MPEAIASKQPSVADTILQQLGGNRFVAMTGAKSFIGEDDSLSMKLPTNITKGRASHCRVTLEQSDTYKIETLKIGKTKDYDAAVVVVGIEDQIYNDQLQAAFTRLTGLDTHL